MAKLTQFNVKQKPQRQNRYFSEQLKQQLVRDIEQNLTTVSEVSRVHQVRRWAVYKWIYKYSPMRKKGVRVVVESKSMTRQVSQLKERVKELEQLVGQKQITIEFLEKMIELTEKELGIDIKKKGRK